MIKGVTFLIPQATTDMLRQILENINVEGYFWRNIVEQDEVWNASGERYLDEESYDGKAFKELIQQDHYIIFIKLQAYFAEGDYDNISYYEDFVLSDCQIVVLIFDNINVHIYTKDEGVAKSLYENAVQRFEEVEYLTDTYDTRTGFDILS
ncbi:MAG: DUF2691 family protein [Coriobacteriia bacterium]|nr:DUF2691 family protein [Coriobacteriia bacterium]MCL2136649.1 DUF2691 family protein [Coriobacteriia bacterium]